VSRRPQTRNRPVVVLRDRFLGEISGDGHDVYTDSAIGRLRRVASRAGQHTHLVHVRFRLSRLLRFTLSRLHALDTDISFRLARLTAVRHISGRSTSSVILQNAFRDMAKTSKDYSNKCTTETALRRKLLPRTRYTTIILLCVLRCAHGRPKRIEKFNYFRQNRRRSSQWRIQGRGVGSMSFNKRNSMYFKIAPPPPRFFVLDSPLARHTYVYLI